MNDERNQRSRETKPQNGETEGRSSETDASEAKAVRTPQVRAGACPKSDAHNATRVYRTIGEVRYCVCDDCGHTWKKSGPPAGAKPAKERAPAA